MNFTQQEYQRIHSLYRKSKVLKWLLYGSIFLPFLWILLLPFLFFYWRSRRKIVCDLNLKEWIPSKEKPPLIPNEVEVSLLKKIHYILQIKKALFFPLAIIILEVLVIGNFPLIFWKPISIVACKDCDFVRECMKHQDPNKPFLPTTVTLDRDSNIVITIDADITDPAACRDSFKPIYDASTEYLRSQGPRFKERKSQPFIIKARNGVITIP